MQAFAAQQQTDAIRRQKLGLFQLKFGREFNEFSLFFYKPQEVPKKWLKLKQSRKNAYKYVCVYDTVLNL